MEISLGLIGTVIGSATFGAIVGKLIDAFLLTKINDNNEKRKWLRETKLEAFSKLSEELLSLGLKSSTFNDRWKFNAIATNAILLIDDKNLVNKIQDYIETLYRVTNDVTSVVKSDIPEDFHVTLPTGEIASKEHIERGVAINQLEKEALSIVEELNKNLKDT